MPISKFQRPATKVRQTKHLSAASNFLRSSLVIGGGGGEGQ